MLWPATRCENDAALRHGAINRVAGEPGVILNISDIVRGGPDDATVTASYSCGNLCAAEYHFRVFRASDGAWRLGKVEILWISWRHMQSIGPRAA